MIQLEEARFRYAISEALAQKLGGSINFINEKQHSEKKWVINGAYQGAATPFLGLDGLLVAEFDMEIFNVWMFNHDAGGSGTTELDIKTATAPGGSYSSIFTTTPKVTSAAAAFSYIGVGDTVSGCTAPVLAAGALTIVAGSALRCDILSVMGGVPKTCGLIAHYRPVSL